MTVRDIDFALLLTRQRDGILNATAQLTLPESSAPAVLAEQIPIVIDHTALMTVSLEPQAYGRCLSAMVFRDPQLRGALGRARDCARHSGGFLRLRICISPPDDALIAVRWELLHDPVDGAPLALGDQILFARSLPSADLEPLRPTLPTDLRALVVVAGPRNLADYNLSPIDIEAVVASNCTALSGLRPEIIARTYQCPASLAAIDRALRTGPHIFSIVCHGTERAGESVLWLEHEDGRTAPTPGSVLVERIAGMRQKPLLVVLSACRSSGNGYAAHALTALGPQLARAGVAAVVAAQGDLPTATAATMLPELFRELLHTGCIDRAMAAARAVARDSAWRTPTLYMRPTDGVLWKSAPPTFRPDQRNEIAAGYVAALTPAADSRATPAIQVRLRPGQQQLSLAQPDVSNNLVNDFEALLGVPVQETPSPANADANLDTLLEQQRCIVLAGAPGAGKSTLLRTLAARLGERWQRLSARGESARLPVVVNLRDWHNSALSLETMLQTSLARWPALVAQLPERISNGQLMLILDGVNELPDLVRDAMTGVIVDQRVAAIAAVATDPQWSRVQCVVSCRYDDQPPGLHWPDLHISPLDRTQIEVFTNACFAPRPELAQRFINNIYGQTNAQGANFQDLVASPTGLRLAIAHMQRAGALPTTPAELIHLMIEHTLRGECAVGTIDSTELPALYQRLGRLAIALVSHNISQVDRTQALIWACSDLTASGPTMTGRLWQIAQSAGLITLEHGSMRFSSRLAQQYLAARYLQQNELNAELLATMSQKRTAPIWVIWRWFEPQLGARIEPFLTDSEAAVRQNAVQALSILNDPRYTLSLVNVLSDSEPDVRYSAAVALAQSGDRRAAPQLLAALRRPEAGLRRESVLLLGRLHERLAEGSIATLLTCDPVGDVRGAAAIALGIIGGSRALPALSGALLDTHLPTCAAAAVALGALGDPEAIQPLQATLVRDSIGVARAAAHALARLGEPAFTSLTDLLTGPPATVGRAAMALGYWHTSLSAMALIAAIIRSDPLTLRSILAALHEIGTPALLPLIEALQGGTVAQRCGAATALGLQADPRTIPHLLAALDDQNAPVCGHTALALGRFGMVVVDALLARLLTANDQTGRYAAIALGELGAAGLSALEVALHDNRPDQRICAIAGLAHTARQAPEMTKRSAVRLLDTARFDIAPAVRHAASYTFAGLAQAMA